MTEYVYCYYGRILQRGRVRASRPRPFGWTPLGKFREPGISCSSAPAFAEALRKFCGDTHLS